MNLATMPSGSNGVVLLGGFGFGGFTGRANLASAHWTGGVCENLGSLGQLCEEGTAVWHR